jgi:hypothetical protein
VVVGGIGGAPIAFEGRQSSVLNAIGKVRDIRDWCDYYLCNIEWLFAVRMNTCRSHEAPPEIG